MTVPALLILALGVLLIIVAVTPTVSRRFQGGIFYGWWLIGIAAIVMILSIVPFFHTMTAWFVGLETLWLEQDTIVFGLFPLSG